MVDFPKINGVYPQFADIEMDIEGLDPMAGFTELNYSGKLEPGAVRGNHPQKLGTTRGEYDADGSVTMLRPWFDQMVTTLGDGWMERRFNMNVTIRVDDSTPIVTDNLLRVRFKGHSNDGSKGSDPLMVKLDLDIELVCVAGKLPFFSARR